MIADQLLSSTESFLQERKVEHVVIGLSYTGVLLDDGCCGLAATLKEEIHGCPDLGQEAGRFGGKNAYHLAQGVSSPNILRSSLGLAVVNAALNRGVKSNTSPPLEALRIGAEDKVGMVGYFGPLIEPVKNTCDRLCVFERRPFEQDFIYSDWVAPQLLPTCDKVIISGTAVINKTIDHLLSRCRGTVALLGPSTPLSPILEGHGVDFLFGSTVTDPEQVLKIIGEGGGTRSFAETVNKVNLDLSRRSPDK